MNIRNFMLLAALAITACDDDGTPFTDRAVITGHPDPVVAGPCVDSYPPGDGFGWNGLTSCQLDDNPGTTTDNQANQDQTVVVSDNQGETTVTVIQQQTVNHEWFVGTWNCAASSDYRQRYQLMLQADMVSVDTSRAEADPARFGTWEALSGNEFSVILQSRSDYSVTSGVAVSDNSSCSREIYPLTEERPQINDPASGELLLLEPALFDLEDIANIGCHTARVEDSQWVIESGGVTWNHDANGVASRTTRLGDIQSRYSISHNGIYSGPSEIEGERWMHRDSVGRFWFYRESLFALACF